MSPFNINFSRDFLSRLAFISLAAFSTSCVVDIEEPTSLEGAENAFPGVDPDSVRRSKVQVGASGEFIVADVARYGDQFLYQGDILVSKDQLQDIELDPPAPTIGQMQAVFTSSQFRVWPGGVIPYVVDDSVSAFIVEAAIQAWASSSTLQFVDWTGEDDYLRFMDDERGCASWVGRQGGEQEVWIGDACSVGSTMHEIGHALGLGHEQNRSDRDDFIEILDENIVDDRGHNFTQLAGFDDIGEYDFGSIMHYGAYFFSKNGSPTIVRRSDPSDTNFGQRIAPSTLDLSAINQNYGLPATDYLRVTAPSANKLIISWGAVRGAANYRVTVRKGVVGSFTISQYYASKDQQTLRLNNASPGTPYLVSVNAVASNGNLSAARLASVTTPSDTEPLSPAAVTGLRASVYGSSSLELFWDRPALPFDYEVRRDGQAVRTLDGTSFYDSGLVSGREYRYEVIAIDSNGQRSAPAEVSAMTP